MSNRMRYGIAAALLAMCLAGPIKLLSAGPLPCIKPAPKPLEGCWFDAIRIDSSPEVVYYGKCSARVPALEARVTNEMTVNSRTGRKVQ